MNESGSLPLFGYGTFRDEQWRARILGASYAWEDAVLAGYRRVVITASGYLSIEPSAFDRVEGVLISLDGAGWAVADAWEDVPNYHRVRVDVQTARGLVAACTYVYAASTHVEPVAGLALLAALANEEVERAIGAFAPVRDRLRRGRSGDGKE
ncbi:hypothetical protein WPS_04180 [Vulcanimicrobium alpinum]|uniref:Putative gamma-glutamylcyclotransferase n=1 Tax=Vulcanimicrobium alpinum TaxID=3016050 RepID=A0AAN2C922_UNVUL|nr:gamma-glutamylcyclotransferase family protein [Vulcanimicrobium alpinum]BDE05142.1 hypothetical protein WPS_04180 [Vulcanimicrobium alpinum]